MVDLPDFEDDEAWNYKRNYQDENYEQLKFNGEPTPLWFWQETE